MLKEEIRKPSQNSGKDWAANFVEVLDRIAKEHERHRLECPENRYIAMLSSIYIYIYIEHHPTLYRAVQYSVICNQIRAKFEKT